MSQPNDNKTEGKKSEQLLIDLTNARQATALDARSILHRMQIEAFLERVSEVVGRVEGFSEKLKQGGDGRTRSVSYERYHDVITLHGKRGSGKTTFLLSALELLQNSAKRRLAFPERFIKDKNDNDNSDDDGLNGLCVLEILDPTLFGLHEHLLLSLMAKIAFEVRSAVKNSERNLCGGHNAHCNLEEWENHLRQFATALKHMGETRDDLDTPLSKEKVEWEDSQFIFEQNMENAQRSFGLEREFHKFLNESLQLIGKRAFVLALDDIDTRPQIGWHVLEVLRRYFTSPQLVVVLSGDMDLFKTIIEKQQLKIFDLNFASDTEVRKEFKSRVDGLTEQYLLKILRTPSRINLGSFQAALQQWTRIKPDATQKIGKCGEYMELERLLKCVFYPLLACNRGVEQRLFKQTLFANPARTVTQILDVLWRVSAKRPGNLSVSGESLNKLNERLTPAECEPVVERMREVFLVSLQNMGIERPYDFVEALQASHGISLIMKCLFEHGHITSGLDLLPTHQDSDVNNALLALTAELTQAMRANPAVLLGYALKACFLREVLLRCGDEINLVQYERYEKYLSLEANELPSMTSARITALHSGQQPRTSLRSLGTVRLYGKSITSNAPAAVKAMYDGIDSKYLSSDESKIPLELKQFCATSKKSCTVKDKSLRRWINTPETLYDCIHSWQREIVRLGVVDMRVRDGYYRVFSIFPLIAAMCDFFENKKESIANLLAQYSQPPTVSVFSSDNAYVSPADELEEESNDIDYDDESASNDEEYDYVNFGKEVMRWCEESEGVFLDISSPTILCERVMSRFVKSLSRIDGEMTNKATFVGAYIHRCIIAFFNSIIVEEFLLKNNSDNEEKVLFDSPTKSDDIFIKNLFSSKFICKTTSREADAVDEQSSLDNPQVAKEKSHFDVSKNYPLFKFVFSCPLWGLYLRPEENGAGDDRSQSVYNIYMNLLTRESESFEPIVNVSYCSNDFHKEQKKSEKTEGKELSSFPNLYHVLNSLAIPKSNTKGPKVAKAGTQSGKQKKGKGNDGSSTEETSSPGSSQSDETQPLDNSSIQPIENIITEQAVSPKLEQDQSKKLTPKGIELGLEMIPPSEQLDKIFKDPDIKRYWDDFIAGKTKRKLEPSYENLLERLFEGGEKSFQTRELRDEFLEKVKAYKP